MDWEPHEYEGGGVEQHRLGGLRPILPFHADVRLSTQPAVKVMRSAGPKTRLMMAVNFTTTFSARPEVPFKGSPTVSLVTGFCALPALLELFAQSARRDVLLRVVPSTTGIP